MIRIAEGNVKSCGGADGGVAEITTVGAPGGIAHAHGDGADQTAVAVPSGTDDEGAPALDMAALLLDAEAEEAKVVALRAQSDALSAELAATQHQTAALRQDLSRAQLALRGEGAIDAHAMRRHALTRQKQSLELQLANVHMMLARALDDREEEELELRLCGLQTRSAVPRQRI